MLCAKLEDCASTLDQQDILQTVSNLEKNNMRKILSIAFISLLIANIYGQEGNLTVNFELTGYGITSSKAIATNSLKSSPSGVQNMTSYTKFIEATDSIPATIDTEFGVFYKFNSNKDITIPVTILWQYPDGMKGINGNTIRETKYTIHKETNFEHFSSYTLEEENELVKGDWIFAMIVNEKVIYKKVFHLY